MSKEVAHADTPCPPFYFPRPFQNKMATKRKRKVAFREDVDIDDKKKKQFEDAEEDISTENQRKSRFKEKHSLDSDEEDEDDNKEESETGLDDEDLAAQEDTTITYDGDIKVTPFNLQEEMEEGYFDSHGNYYEKDNSDEIKDNWMDNLDWVKIEEQNDLLKGGKQTEEDEEEEPVDRLVVYQQMLEIINPGETILKAVRRLGGTKTLSASERWKKKKLGKKQEEEDSNSKNSEDKASLEYLTGLADQLLAIGEYSIYEDTYEKIKFKITQEEKNKEPVDIFSDDPVSSSGQPPPPRLPALDEVTWEYRWEDKEDADIHGPYSSTQMSEWKENGYFQDGVFVRKSNQKDAQFYNSKRIDFDLYT